MQTKPDSTRCGFSGGFAAKARIGAILGSGDFEQALGEIDIPPEKLINPLLSFLCATDELVRWRAVRDADGGLLGYYERYEPPKGR